METLNLVVGREYALRLKNRFHTDPLSKAVYFGNINNTRIFFKFDGKNLQRYISKIDACYYLDEDTIPPTPVLEEAILSKAQIKSKELEHIMQKLAEYAARPVPEVKNRIEHLIT